MIIATQSTNVTLPLYYLFIPFYVTTSLTALSFLHTVMFMIAAPSSVAFSVASSCAR
jgi:hypothetical protein